MKGHGAAELENSICIFLEKHQIKFVEANHMIMDQICVVNTWYYKQEFRKGILLPTTFQLCTFPKPGQPLYSGQHFYCFKVL